MQTKNSVLRELDRMSEEAFRLYSLGMYQQAISEGTGILRLANEKLGRWNPNLNIYYKNLEFLKTEGVRFENNQRVNTSNNQTSNYFLLRELNENIITFYKLTRYQDAYKEANKALFIAIKTFGKYHPYVRVLHQNIASLEKQKNLSVNEFKTHDTISKKISRNGRNKIILFSIIAITLFITLFTVSIYIRDNVPSIEIISSNKDNISPFTQGYSNELKDKVLIEDAPLILQYPELPRGCEVTSLAMLLQYAGVKVDKRTLADEVKKDTTPLVIKEGRIHYGNPNYGFVGSQYSLNEPGLGVYHGPIKELMEGYLPEQTVDLTGRPFSDLYYFLNKGIPVWVITNTHFSELDPKEFQVWYTESGPIQITYRQHSVLVTGYDKKYIYFNDPLKKEKHQRVEIDSFKRAWEQMGRQAISYIPDGMNLLEILPLD